jgi:hypothetical protein
LSAFVKGENLSIQGLLLGNDERDPMPGSRPSIISPKMVLKKCLVIWIHLPMQSQTEPVPVLAWPSRRLDHPNSAAGDASAGSQWDFDAINTFNGAELLAPAAEIAASGTDVVRYQLTDVASAARDLDGDLASKPRKPSPSRH